MDSAKNKLFTYTDTYKTTYPFNEEYQLYLKSNRPEIEKRKEGNKFLEMKNVDNIGRQYLDYPETLYAMLLSRLSKEEWEWFQSSEGQIWYGRKYPEFSGGKLN